MPPTDHELLDLAGRVGAACVRRDLTIATAESCTAGLVAHLLTEIPGSSAYFRGGLVTYADDVKHALAGVPEGLLETHGAVSPEVAVAMAIGARRAVGTDLAVAVTGIAGPSGGTSDKPVGLTFVAVADDAGDDVRRFVWSEDRSGNKRASAAAALAMVVERIG